MIELVLDDAGVEIIGDEVEFVAAAIPGLNANAFIAGNQPAQIGNTKTALPILFHFLGQRCDLGIHQHRERHSRLLRVTWVIDDMIETMKEYEGVGLAADQVHESKQIAVLEVADNPRYPQKPRVPLTVLVNPKITPLSEDMEEDWEGCLSVPDLRGLVPRYKSIHVQAWDRDGNELDFVADDFHARVIQHEFDHLNGKVYLDRMRDFSTLTFLQEFARYWMRP